MLPHETYYRACVGRWHAPFRGRVSDFDALRRAIGSADAITYLLLCAWPAWLARPWIRTSVAFEAEEWVHTTEIAWLGLPLMQTRETLQLGEDGRSFTLRGCARFPALPWRREEIRGEGHVDEDGLRAHYRLHFMGAEMAQTGQRRPDGATLTQSLPGFEAEQVLVARD